MKNDIVALAIIGLAAISVTFCVYYIAKCLYNDDEVKTEKFCECGRAIEPEVIIKKYPQLTPIIIVR